MSRFQPPNVPFIEAAHHGGKQRPTAIELRASFTTADAGAALGRANYLHQRNAPTESYHYILDASTVYRCVPANRTAFNLSPDPKGKIAINLCVEPVTEVEFWDDADHVKVMDRTVDLVAQLALTHKIPLRYLDDDAYLKWSLRRWRRNGGIIIRVAGEWPHAEFLANVKAQVAFFKSHL